jgi:hypothetical protein
MWWVWLRGLVEKFLLRCTREQLAGARYATPVRNLAFAATALRSQMDIRCCTAAIQCFEVIMFSLISLYFAARRDVVLAERFVAGLADAPAAAPAPVAAPATIVEAAPLPLAA